VSASQDTTLVRAAAPTNALGYGLSAFVGSVLLLILLMALSWKIENETIKHADQVAHTYRVLANLAQIRAESLQIEISTQNFRLTANEATLPERDAARERRSSLMEETARLVNDNPAQQTRWSELSGVIQSRQAVSRQVEQLRRTEGADAASSFIARSNLAATRSRLVEILAEMRSEEIALLEARVKRQVESRRFNDLTQLLVALAMLALIVAAFLLLRSNHRSMLASRELAERATRARTEFLANMSHEIRTPLNAIVGLTHVLDRTELPPDARALVGRMRWASAGLTDLISVVLDVSKIDAGALTLEATTFDIATLFAETMLAFAEQASEKGIAAEIALDESLPSMVIGDPVRIGQIINNLLSNALKFTEQGHISLQASSQVIDEKTCIVSFSVRDTGIGVAPESQSLIFEPFLQAESSTTRRYGGTGLGLSIVRRLSELMEGGVELTSERNVGSCFRVTLKLGRAHETELAALAARDTSGIAANAAVASTPLVTETKLQASQQPLAALRVLVVDDNSINREVAERILCREGAEVLTCKDGQQAVTAIRSDPHRFDVVLMDIQMPVLDGYEATRIIRNELGLAHLPIIAVTAGALAGERERALGSGMNDFVTKPLRPAELVRTLSSVRQRRNTSAT
jgi:signal transduction histidine kinase/ActR/RegA family two-component response regulator